ncbi:hypothetical protein GCM10011405_23970 [Rufibacter glacialis]|nr:hypothetical protein GCM10011405_23970 [Rufibacter glacialis]
MVVARAANRWHLQMSAGGATSQARPASQAKAAETRRNANALKYLKPVPKAVLTRLLRKDTAPVIEPPVTVR